MQSLVLISTSPALSVERELPPPTEDFTRFVTTAEVDRSDSESVIEYLVDYSRVLAGGARPFDEGPMRALVRRDVERARNFAAAQNHDVLPDGEPARAPLSSISAPTLVIHGSGDPMFPLPHGEALAEAIPGAQLLSLDGAGHGVDRADWAIIVSAVCGAHRPDRFVAVPRPGVARLPCSVDHTLIAAPSGSPSDISATRSSSSVVAMKREPSESSRPTMIPVRIGQS